MKPARLLGAVLLFCATAAWGAPRVLDGIVARVDQSVVTWSQVLQEQELLAWSGDAAGSADLKVVAQSLVRRQLLVTEAHKMRIEVGPSELAEEVTALAGAGGEPAAFWERARRAGLGEADLRRRSQEVLLTRRYLAVRQEMTYVPEAEVRAYYAGHPEFYGGKPLFQVREEVRALLSKRKYEQELDQWFSKQVDEGRVRLFDLPAPPAHDAPR